MKLCEILSIMYIRVAKPTQVWKMMGETAVNIFSGIWREVPFNGYMFGAERAYCNMNVLFFCFFCEKWGSIAPMEFCLLRIFLLASF